jgi:hypothetical protein
MLRYSLVVSAALATVVSAASAKAPIFEDPNGIVVMEIESGALAAEHSWKGETRMDGYTGKGYYTWRGGNLFGNPGQGIIGFRFRVSKDGKYHLRLRNRHDFKDSTLENDCWTKLDNNQWVKTFSSQRGQWTWRTNFEYSGDNKPAAVWDLKAGMHVLLISGRSAGFSIDRIHIYLDGVSSKVAEDSTLPETRPGKKAASPSSRPAQPAPGDKGSKEGQTAMPSGAAPTGEPVKQVPPRNR